MADKVRGKDAASVKIEGVRHPECDQLSRFVWDHPRKVPHPGKLLCPRKARTSGYPRDAQLFGSLEVVPSGSRRERESGCG